MSNLIAYIPVLNNKHINWFKENPGSDLYIISQNIAENLLPRLGRNPAMVSTENMVNMIFRSKDLFDLNSVSQISLLDFPNITSATLPNEDISIAFAEKYLYPKGVKLLHFETIWARWDMLAVKRNSPVIPDYKISNSFFDDIRMETARKIAPQSPDWWRQIGAVAFNEKDELLAVACNMHMPNEYEVYIFGDPRTNYDAGQFGVYTSIHAEKAVVVICAKKGLALDGSSLYVTTFPCEGCAREIALAGVNKLFFEEGYSTLNAQEVLKSNRVEIIQVVKTP